MAPRAEPFTSYGSLYILSPGPPDRAGRGGAGALLVLVGDVAWREMVGFAPSLQGILRPPGDAAF